MAAKRCWGAFSEFGSEPSPQSADFDSLNQILLGFGRWFTHDGRSWGTGTCANSLSDGSSREHTLPALYISHALTRTLLLQGSLLTVDVSQLHSCARRGDSNPETLHAVREL